jgi:recombination protein RecT
MKTDGSDQDEKGKALERSPVQSLKDLLNSEYVKHRFMEVMGEKATVFLASILNAVQKNPDLAKCDQKSLLSAAMVAATLDLPIDSNLGFAAIVSYNTKFFDKKNKKEYWVTLAQFQIMYKGFIQLALRSGQYKTINVSPIYEDEFESYDIITGDIIIHPVQGGYREQENYDKIIGYAAFFRLINGFERLEYWPLSKIIAHGKKYSKSFDKASGLWKKDPHAMYAKTVLKNSLSKWGILSVVMQNAIATDQGVLKDWRKPIDSENVNYFDNNLVTEEGEAAEVTEGVTEEQSPNQDTGANGNESQQAENGSDPAQNPVSTTEKPENKEPETKAPEPTAAAEGNGDQGLFSPEESAALEQQYQKHHAGNEYPDFGG